MDSKLKKNWRYNMRTILYINLFFTLAGCVTIPKSTAQLNILLGNQIAESKMTHINLIDEWVRERRERTEQFLEYRWIPKFIINFMDESGEPYKNLKEVMKNNCKMDRADEIKEITAEISRQIEKIRKYLFGEIDRQVSDLKEKVLTHYAETERMHRTITANLNSVVKGQDFEKQIREALAKPLKEIAPIKKASETLDKILMEVQ